MGIASLGGILSGAGDVSRPDMGQATGDFSNLVSSYLSQSPGLYANEAQYKPQYAALDTGIYGKSYRDTMSSVLPSTVSALRKSQPNSTELMDMVTNQAAEQLKQNGALDPNTQRQVQQNVRTSQAARGLGYGPGDAAQEQFYQTQTQESRRAQNQQLATDVAEKNYSMWGAPAFQAAAGAASAAGAAGVGASPTLGPKNMDSLLTMPYQASVEQNVNSAKNATSLYQSMDSGSSSFMSSL